MLVIYSGRQPEVFSLESLKMEDMLFIIIILVFFVVSRGLIITFQRFIR